MSPGARLEQASFEDLDLLLADNFARAAKSAGVSQIFYVGGLLPDGPERSRHLASRFEVERALAAYATPVTALRAGLVVGPGGSSLQILTRLVRRLPCMITPKWTASLTQPIAVGDVVRAVEIVLREPQDHRGAFDIGGPDIMSYRQMMARTAEVLGLSRHMWTAPVFTPALSSLWVSLVTNCPRQLVGPLIHSLEHPMTVRPNPLQERLEAGAERFEDALAQAIEGERRSSPSSGPATKSAVACSTVRSVQRLPRPPGWTARKVGERYLKWLPSASPGILSCEREGETIHFRVRGLAQPVLVLRYSEERSTEDRSLLYVEGGSLARTDSDHRGRLEFRTTPASEDVLAAVHDFHPRLPWFLYRATHAPMHLLVMRACARHLRRVGLGDRRSSDEDTRSLPA